MTTQTITAMVRYQGQWIHNVAISLESETTGKAAIDGKSRRVTYRISTHGKAKGTMQWHCDE